jgi:hypothetical protein
MKRKRLSDNPDALPLPLPPQMDLIRVTPTEDGKVVYQSWFEPPAEPLKPKVAPNKEQVPYYRSGYRISYSNGWQPSVYLEKLRNVP